MLGWLRGRRGGAAPAADAQALVVQAHAAHGAGRLEEAQKGYRRALRADPDCFDAHYLLGVIGLQHSSLEDALGHFQQAVRINPQSAAAQNGLGQTCRRLGRAEEALACLTRATELDPQLGEAWFNLGGLLRSLGRSAEAADALGKAVSLNPEFAEAHAVLGFALREAGRIDDALASSQRALALQPGSAQLHVNVGNLLRERGFLDEAAAAYRAALERDPRRVEALNNLGNVLRHQGRVQEALLCYERALTIKPDFAEALLNAAQLLREQGRLADAVTAYRLLLETHPGMAEAHLDLGNAFRGMADTARALEHYARALEIDPDYAEARWAQTMSQLPMVAEDEAEQRRSRERFGEELAALEPWCRERGAWRTARAVGGQQPFYLAYQDGNHREAMARYGSLCAELLGAWQEAAGLPRPARITRAEVRIGIASAHIRDHSVWHAITKGWVEHLDRSRFDVRLYHLGNANDVETAFAKTLVTHYSYGKSDFGDWARFILSHQLDALIYPEVGIDPVTAKLASLRLAPVQATTWGHPLTSGLPTIDYFLSAEALEAPGAEAHYTEKLVRLPGFGSTYAPAKVAPAALDLGALGLRPDVPLLLCPGTPFKYVPRFDAILIEIARRLGECQFAFFVPQVPEVMQRLRLRMERSFAAAGLELSAYARFLPWQSRAGFYGLMGEADVYLDSIGFSGYNTALQAIECGLPIVAHEGAYLRGRLASGILRRMGLDELVAESEAAYVEAAVRLARDAHHWGGVQERLAAARPALQGGVESVRALESFIEGALDRD